MFRDCGAPVSESRFLFRGFISIHASGSVLRNPAAPAAAPALHDAQEHHFCGSSAAPARPPAVLLRAEYSFHPETGSARPFAAPFCNSLSGRGIFRHSLCGSGSQFRRHSASAPPDRSLSGNSLPDSPPASAEKNAAVHSAASYGIAFLGGINPYRLRLSGTAPRSCRSSAGQRCNPNRHPLWTRRAAAPARQTLSDHK